MTKKTIALASLAIAGMMVSWSANAAPIEVKWCGDVSFNTSECLFGAFQATELTSITAKTATYGATTTEEDGGTDFEMFLQIGGDWVSVWTDSKDKEDGNFSIELINGSLAFLFAEAAVTGIKFKATPDAGGQDYTAFNMQQTSFFFNCIDCGGGGDDDDDTTPVPEPGTLALLGIGLAGLGLSRRRGLKKS